VIQGRPKLADGSVDVVSIIQKNIPPQRPVTRRDACRIQKTLAQQLEAFVVLHRHQRCCHRVREVTYLGKALVVFLGRDLTNGHAQQRPEVGD